jgi:hypothetical protein
MAAKKVISRVGQRWQRPLALELLEDRFVPSISGTLAPLAVTFAGDDGEVVARHQQTRTLEEDSLVHHTEQPSSSVSRTVSQPSSEDHAPALPAGTAQTTAGSDDDGSRGATSSQSSTTGSAPAPSAGTAQTTAGSNDDASSGATGSLPSTDDHALAPSAGTTQTTAGSDDGASSGATGGLPSTDDHAPAPSAGTVQTTAGSDDDGSSSATGSLPSTDDHAPAPSAGNGQTPAGSSDDGSSGATGSRPPSEDNPPAPSAGVGQTSAGSDDHGASTPVSQPLSGEESVQGSTHKVTGVSGSGSAPLAPLGLVSSTSQGTDAGTVKTDSSGTGTSTIGSLPSSSVDVFRKDGHPSLSVDPPPGVMRPASAIPLEGLVADMSQASAGANAGEPGKSSAPAEAPLPAVAGLIGGEVVPLDLASLEAAWQNFLGNLHDCANNLTLLSTRGGAGPWIVFAALTTTAFELARRQLKRPSEKLLLFEAADGRSSGLKHPPARPEP